MAELLRKKLKKIEVSPMVYGFIVKDGTEQYRWPVIVVGYSLEETEERAKETIRKSGRKYTEPLKVTAHVYCDLQELYDEYCEGEQALKQISE